MTMHRFAPLTKNEALTVRDFHAPAQCAKKGRAVNWRRNGQTKTWKRNAERFAVPVTFGLYGHDTLTEDLAGQVCPAERCPVCNPDKE
jgi:hypothetical protein